VAAQEPPDILDVDVAQFPGQQGAGPAGEPGRRRFIEQLQNPLVGRFRVDGLLAWPRLVLQPFKAKLRIAMPPKADNPRLDPNFLGDRPSAAPGRRQKNNLRPLQIALASSTLRSFLERWTSLASGIIPMLNHDSRSKKSRY
jgi:hypothetical protein